MRQDAPDEIQLVEAAKAGDERAFTELFSRYFSMIHAFAARLCLSVSDADDVAQETFIKAARSLHQCRPDSFRAWLYRIARNSALDRHRSRQRESLLAESFAVAREESENGANNSDQEAVEQALASLPAPLREAIVLTVLEGMSHKEAARIAGCAEPTISWRVFTAKRKLKKTLSRKS